MQGAMPFPQLGMGFGQQQPFTSAAAQFPAAAMGLGMGGFQPLHAHHQHHAQHTPQQTMHLQQPLQPQQQQQQQPAAMQQTQQPGQQQPRKVHNNDQGDPSKVIHCRNVTSEVTQSGLMHMCAQFGRVVNVVMLRAKCQALIEMDTLENARKCVESATDGYILVDSRRVYVKFSRHTALSDVPPGKTLLVSMYNANYDISTHVQLTPLIVYQIFGNYGPVEKIVVLPKNATSQQNHNRVQALVQFDTKENAESVKDNLQGQPVNLGDQASFMLDIQFSKVKEITATSNSATSMVVPKGYTPTLLAQQQLGNMGGNTFMR